MKKLLTVLSVLILSLTMFSCSVGPEGEQGPAGSALDPIVAIFQQGVLPGGYIGCVDSHLASAGEGDKNFGGCDESWLGHTGAYQRRPVILFDITSSGIIPVTATVVKAELTIFVTNYTGNPLNITAYQISRSWVEGAGACTGTTGVNVSWNNYNGTGNTWTTPGGDYGSAVSSQVTLDSAGYFSFELNASMVTDWLQNSAQNYGILIKDDDEASTEYLEIATSEHANAAFRPKLTVYYTLQ